ncbi:hypothetical protein ND748_17365 [Frankia sp. AiPs1]|uniref:hypothetical protein n=1 Tax=Frankia sp. AiPs1 TaxID=573493 RepID=UPI002043D719|nr:hypothetical protein [Frankia sp. AiPs1]MCM3923423.1 hypothetical protein [Frankia sp. AiPs1]
MDAARRDKVQILAEYQPEIDCDDFAAAIVAWADILVREEAEKEKAVIPSARTEKAGRLGHDSKSRFS